jgi:prolyl-tRNA synthetase
MSRLFFQTLREAPAEAHTISHRLLLRAGLVRPAAGGGLAYLPLGRRVQHKVVAIARQEVEAVGGQEVTLPTVQPVELWKRSGHWPQVRDEVARFKDRSGRDLCLGARHEAVITDLVSQVVSSHRQLPVVLYQIRSAFRDEPRPRSGPMWMREFAQLEVCSFHPDDADLDAFYPQMQQACHNLFRRCGLDVVLAESDPGVSGGTTAHEFVALSPVGDATLLLCDACGYRADREVAAFRKPRPPVEEPLPLEEVHTPGADTIEALARFLDIPTSRTAKALFLVAEVGDYGEERFVFAVLRGDMALSEAKLRRAIGAWRLRPATEEEIRAIGAEPGYGSPIISAGSMHSGVDRSSFLLVVDDLIPASPNLVAGANKPDYHYRNVNYGRDYSADIVADIAAANPGDACPVCGNPMHAQQGVVLGKLAKVGTRYSEALGATFQDERGESHAVVMGCCHIELDRLMALVIEQHHDEHGIRWPVDIAPYQVALVSLATAKTPAVAEAADVLYRQLMEAGIEVLYDDRDERAGVKFNDADLIGLPLRLTVGARGLEKGVVELKVRHTGERREIPLDEADLGGRVAAVLAEITSQAVPRP